MGRERPAHERPAGRGRTASGVVGPDRRSKLNSVAYFVALPALVFASTHDRTIGAVVSPALVVGLLVVVLVMPALAWLTFATLGAEESTLRAGC